MKKIVLISIAFVFALHVQAQKGKKKKTVVAEKVILKTEIDSFSYALGMSIGESLKNTGSTNVNTELLTTAMKQIFNDNKTVMSKEDANNTLQQKLQAFTQRKKEAQIQEGKSFLFINGKRPNVTTLPNGLQYEVLIPGNIDNPKPRITDTVKVNYAGSLITGVEFENSIKNGGPVTFPVNGVVRGWQQALQLMPKGATWKIYIPSELGYGENPPSYDIPQNAVLIFEIALIDIKAAQTPEK
jgi:FKBP-type peptidyl-prolyl cis-trans isomerase FklB